jgi:amidase
MARTIADVSLFFESVSSSTVGKMRTPEEHLRKLPIGILEDDGHIPVTQETRAAVRAAAHALKERGFELVPFVSKHLEPARMLWQDFFIRCGRTLLEPVIQGREDQLSATFNYFLNFARSKSLITAAELLATWADADQLRETLTRELATYTAVVTPVAAIPAFRHGERRWLIEGRPLEYFDAMRFTQWFNLLGAPAAVVPVGRSSEGLPIGVQVASYPHADEIVLAVAGLIDKDFGYRPPPMAYC